MAVIKKILYYGERIQVYIAITALSVIVISITYGVILRRLGSPVPWAEEMSILMFIWLSFMAAGAAYYRKKYIVSDLLISYLSDRNRAIMNVVGYMLALIFVAVATYATLLLLTNMIFLSRPSLILRVPRLYYYMPMMFTMPYITLNCLVDLIEALRDLIRAKSDSHQLS